MSRLTLSVEQLQVSTFETAGPAAPVAQAAYETMAGDTCQTGWQYPTCGVSCDFQCRYTDAWWECTTVDNP